MFRAIINAGGKLKDKIMMAGGDEYDDYVDEGQYDTGETYYDEPIREYSQDPISRKMPEKSAKRYGEKIAELGYSHPANAGILPFTPQELSQIVIANPKTIKDACEICTHLSCGRTIVVNLAGVEAADSQRIADYLGGVVHALHGDTTRIDKNIIMITSREFVEVVSYDAATPKTKDYNMFKTSSR